MKITTCSTWKFSLWGFLFGGLSEACLGCGRQACLPTIICSWYKNIDRSSFGPRCFVVFQMDNQYSNSCKSVNSIVIGWGIGFVIIWDSIGTAIQLAREVYHYKLSKFWTPVAFLSIPSVDRFLNYSILTQFSLSLFSVCKWDSLLFLIRSRQPVFSKLRHLCINQ